MKAKTREEMANLYGVNRKTFVRWLKVRNIKIPEGLICPKDQKLIVEVLGLPQENETRMDVG
jgi:abortive infection bacteriophage resistance protein